MVAMILIVLCAGPALKIYTNMYKQQSEIVHDYEADHLVNLVHAKIVEGIYKNTVSFDDLLNCNSHPFDDHNLSGQLKKVGFTCHYTINKIYQRKVKGEQFIRYLFELSITLKNKANQNKNYFYNHYVQGPPIQGILLEEELDEEIEESEQVSQANQKVGDPKAAKKKSGLKPFNGGGTP